MRRHDLSVDVAGPRRQAVEKIAGELRASVGFRRELELWKLGLSRRVTRPTAGAAAHSRRGIGGGNAREPLPLR